VVGSTSLKQDSIQVNRHYFELCVLSQLALELKSGDLFVPGSDQFADYREQLISWEEYDTQVVDYAAMMKLQTEPLAFTAKLAEQLSTQAKQVDQSFPENSFVRLEKDKLVIRKKQRLDIPPELKKLDKLMSSRLPETNILDILVEMESWLDLSLDFQPVSGQSSRLKNRRERFIMTLFCYGFNFGPTQTRRMVKGFSRRQLRWLNLRHATEEKLESAIEKVINRYNRFMLPKH
jgi:hypothetical protein